MKLLPLILIISILTITSAAANSCSIQNLCYDDNNNSFCAPNADHCTYRIHTWNGTTCTYSDELDADGDGWTNSCDAFAADSNEWIDLDGDGVGHNADCDDTNETVTVCGDNKQIETTITDGNETDRNETATGDEDEKETPPTTRKSSTGSGSNGQDNIGTVQLLNNPAEDPEAPQKPQADPVIENAPKQPADDENSGTDEESSVVDEDEPSNHNQVTGLATGTVTGRVTWSWSIIGLILLLCAYWIIMIWHKSNN